MKTLPLIVVGHVDHGKTSLVRVLTGIKTDRLPEEKARGISILPGFAHHQFADVRVDFIDAPGHENYIRAMVSGASGADAALLVVSAVDGLEVQSLEHLNILQHLGYSVGIVAVTKVDLLSEEERADCEADIRAGLSATFLCDANMVFCSSKTGEGLDALGTEIAALHGIGKGRAMPPCTFFPIDRVFSAQGLGTIATGTLLGGAVCTGDALTLSPAGLPVTVRTIQTRGLETEQAMPGQRVAMNLRDIAVSDVHRGSVLHTEDRVGASLECDAQIELSDDMHHPLKHMAHIRVLYGAGHATATVRLYEGKQIEPGSQAFARLKFDTSVTLFAGQRIILRSHSPAQTLGGACVIDPVAQPANVNKRRRLATLKATSEGELADIASALADEGRGVARRRDILRFARQSTEEMDSRLPAGFVDIADGLISPVSVVDEVQQEYVARLRNCHLNYPLKPFVLPNHARDQKHLPELIDYIEARLESEGTLILSGEGVALASHAPLDALTSNQQKRMQQIDRGLDQVGLKPPAADVLCDTQEDADLLGLLIYSKKAIRLYNVSLKQSLVFHGDALAKAIETLHAAYPNGVSFSTGEARETLGTTRKYIVPLLEHFDDIGVTQRSGDKRSMA